MEEHLAEISRRVTDGAHAVILLDRAGWHQSRKLRLPENTSLLPLPPYSPELNPPENVWQYLRQNEWSNRVYESYKDILRACRDGWNNLMAQPDRLASIIRREWAEVKL
jgi:transposase